MLQKLKAKLLTTIALLSLLVPIAAPATVLAVDPDIRGNLCGGASELKFNPATGACDRIATDPSSFNDVLARIINVISVIVGVVAVIMIIVGGFKYITSSGEAEKVKGAKNTILYGLIGLIIVALAQVIVRFVLKEATGATP